MNAALSPNVTDAMRRSFGYTFNQFFISCMYSMGDCLDSDWQWYYDPKYGNCFRFNSGFGMNGSKTSRLQTVSQNSQSTGLIVELFVGNNFNFLGSVSGVHVFINNNSVRVNSLLGFGAAPGVYTYVAMRKTVTELLPYPYNDCVEDVGSINGYNSDLFRSIVMSNFSYNQETCYSVYQQTQITQNCKCYYTLLINAYNYPRPCTSVNEYRCTMVVFRRLILNDFKAKLKKECPLECDDLSYSYSLSYNK